MAYPHKWSPISYKSSAGQQKHIGQRPMLYRWTTQGGSAVPLSRGELGSRLTQCGPGRGLLPYQVASSSIQSFGHNRHGLKTGGCAPFKWGICNPHLIQRRLDRYLWPWAGPALLRRQFNASCTSGFVDNVMFSYKGPHGAWR